VVKGSEREWQQALVGGKPITTISVKTGEKRPGDEEPQGTTEKQKKKKKKENQEPDFGKKKKKIKDKHRDR
jgi:hypothetical protein